MTPHIAWLTAFLVLALISSNAQAASPKFEQSNAYAVVIGISQYREEVISKIPYAAKDAEAIAQVLEVQGGIPKTHIKLLTDSKATNTDIRSHVNDWLSMRVKPDSIVYIYYAGHGTPNPQTGDVYLVPWDGNPDFPSSLYSLKDFYAGLNKLPTKEILVMLDSCFSGAPGRSVLAKGSRPMVISLENPLLAGGKIAVLSASTGNQISSDYDKGGHGLFTHYLLAGFAGAADKDKNHLVTLKELYPYVRNHVSETALDELNREQTPMLLPGEDVLGARARQSLVQVVPGSTPSITTQAEQPKPIQEARARPYEAPRQTGKEITGKDGAPMVLVPAGEFTMGREQTIEENEKPVHRVSLDNFYMDKYEMTTKHYAAFLQATGRATPGWWNDASQVSDGDRPVIGVDWNDAEAYCKWAGKRLPTEAEWEKAARGTDGRMYPWGNEEASGRYANFNKCCDWKGYVTLTVGGEYEAGKSPYGLYDMAGNVWEWVADWYDKEYYLRSPDRNPTGPSGGSDKVTRGGSWYNHALWLPSSYRGHQLPGVRNFTIGFRCAQDAQ